MKISRKTGVLTLTGALVLGVGVMTSIFNSQKALDVVAANPTTKWGVIGSMAGSGWSTDLPFTFDSVDNRFELTLDLTAGTTFKLRYNKSYAKEINYYSNGISNDVKKLCSLSGGSDFKIISTGNYTFTLPSNIEEYGEPGYGLGLIKNVTTVYTVDYYNGSEKIGTEQIISGNSASGKYIKEDGYGLEGWYIDSSLTARYENAPITSNTKLYGNYITDGLKTIIVDVGTTALLDSSSLYFYIWKNTSDDPYVAYPGEQMTQISDSNLYSVEIDSVFGFDKMIVNNNTDDSGKTSDLDLPDLATPYIKLNSLSSYEASEFQVKLYQNWLSFGGAGPIEINNPVPLCEPNKLPLNPVDIYLIKGDKVKLVINDTWIKSNVTYDGTKGSFNVDGDGNLEYTGNTSNAFNVKIEENFKFTITDSNESVVEGTKTARENEMIQIIKNATEGKTICETGVGVLPEYQDFFTGLIDIYDRLVAGGLDLSEVSATVEIVRNGLSNSTNNTNILFNSNNASSTIIVAIFVTTSAVCAIVGSYAVRKKKITN